MAPFFSIILPVYNVKDYLLQCVLSVQEQSFQDFEMILVDDGATDGSGELCDRLAEQYGNITVVHKKNGGLGSARNAGMLQAQGKYIWWVDSDDWIVPGALERLHQAAMAELPEMIKFNYCRKDETETTVLSNVTSGSYTSAEIGKLRETALITAGKYILSACTHIYRTDFLRRIGLEFVSEREVGSEDYLFNLTALMEACSVTVIEDCLYIYRMRLGSLTQKYRKNLLGQYTQLYLQIRQMLQEKNVLEQYDAMVCRMYVRHLLHSCGIPNEYIVTGEHSLREGRRNVRRILRSPECRYAVAKCHCAGLTGNQRIHLLAMRIGFEPVFCWMWKGKQNENKIKEA